MLSDSIGKPVLSFTTIQLEKPTEAISMIWADFYNAVAHTDIPPIIKSKNRLDTRMHISGKVHAWEVTMAGESADPRVHLRIVDRYPNEASDPKSAVQYEGDLADVTPQGFQDMVAFVNRKGQPYQPVTGFDPVPKM